MPKKNLVFIVLTTLFFAFPTIFYANQLQAQRLSGQVFNSDKVPLGNVNITVKGTGQGTDTNDQGNFALNILTGDTIIASQIGFETKEVPIGDSKTITIILQRIESSLDSVVVIGYGTQKRANLTGSVATMNAKQLSTVKTANVGTLLAGNLPGLVAVQRSGEPGNDNPSLSIRGFGSPLIVIDGVVSSGYARNFNRMNQDEIESITILKDAASTAVYGAAGGNGVILVTTKKGVRGKAQLNYTMNYGWQHTTRYPRFVNSAEFAELKNEASYNIGGPEVFKPEEIEKFRNGSDPLNYPNIDYYKVFVKDYAPQVQHDISLSGGTDKVKYYFLFGKTKQDFIWNGPGQEYNIYNVRSNLDIKVNENLNVLVGVGGRAEDLKTDNQGSYLMASWMQYQWPVLNPYTPEGSDYVINGNYGLVGHLNTAKTGYRKAWHNIYQTNLDIIYNIPFVTGLKAKATLAHDYWGSEEKTWFRAYGLYNWDVQKQESVQTGSRNPNTLGVNNRKETNTRVQVSLNYSNTFGEKHGVDGLLLYEQLEDKTTGLSGSRINYVVPIDQIFAGPLLGQTNAGTASEFGREGYVGRLNYNYASKYLFEYSFRYDGSIRFPKENRWGFFPGVSAGWRISEEGFFKSGVSSITNLKLRASYGVTGYDNITAYQYLTGYTYPSSFTYGMGGNIITPGMVEAGLPNPNVTWERMKAFNLGLELGLWNRLLEMELDIFQRNRSGVLANRALQLPITFGAVLPSENLNSDITRGFEIVARHAHSFGAIDYNIVGNVSYSKTKNQHIESREFTSQYDSWRNNLNNRNTNYLYALKAIGQFQSIEEIKNSPIQDGKANSTLLPGDLKFDDYNGDGIIDGNDNQLIGRGYTPEIMYGLNTGIQWKKLGFSMLWQGAANFVVQLQHFLIQPFANNMSTYAYFLDRWHRADPKDPNSEWIAGKYPAIRNDGTPNNNQLSSFWIKNASYLRLKALNLNYDVYQPLMKKVGLTGLTVFVSGQNILTFSNKDLKYIDPEMPTGRLSYYPQQSIYSFGLTATF